MSNKFVVVERYDFWLTSVLGNDFFGATEKTLYIRYHKKLLRGYRWDGGLFEGTSSNTGSGFWDRTKIVYELKRKNHEGHMVHEVYVKLEIRSSVRKHTRVVVVRSKNLPLCLWVSVTPRRGFRVLITHTLGVVVVFVLHTGVWSRGSVVFPQVT